jgi:septum formation protein
MTKVVLASTSRWRQELLANTGLFVVCADPGVDEAPLVGGSAAETARIRALAKAQAVARDHPGLLVIGADQVAHLDGEAFGKPKGPADWLQRLQRLRGRAHTLTTAVAIVDDGGQEVFTVDSVVRFRADLTDDDLQAYIAFGEASGCAGGYMVEQRGAWLVESVQGDWTNVVGLPIFALVARLRARGFTLAANGVAARGER